MNRELEFVLKGKRPYLLLALVTLSVWGQTVRFEFVWDDNYFIRDLQSVRSLRHVPEMFYRLDAQSTVPDGFVLFRPIRTLHYALLHTLGGAAVPQPWIYHLANVLWHGAAAMMLFSVLTLLLPRLRECLAAGRPRKVAQEAFWQVHRRRDEAGPMVEQMRRSALWTERRAAVALLRRWGQLTASQRAEAEADSHVAVRHAARWKPVR